MVIVGAGPAGLEAARVAGERGHEVILHEAAPQAGGQLRLTAQNQRRREMIGVSDWRVQQCEQLGVEIRYNSFADAEAVLADEPDVVIIATGGLPHTEVLKSGNEHVVSTWDIVSGDVKPGSDVLIYDDAGDHAGMQAAEVIAASGAKLEVMTRDRSFAPEVMAMNLVPYMRSLQKRDVKFTVTYLVESVRKEGNMLVATIGSDYGGISKEQRHDQIIVNHGTRPNDDLYHALIPHSVNEGAVDYDDLIDGKRQARITNPAGKFQLFRIGDAISARNTHAAVYDALRLVKDI